MSTKRCRCAPQQAGPRKAKARREAWAFYSRKNGLVVRANARVMQFQLWRGNRLCASTDCGFTFAVKPRSYTRRSVFHAETSLFIGCTRRSRVSAYLARARPGRRVRVAVDENHPPIASSSQRE